MNERNARLLVVEDNEDDERLILRAIRGIKQDIDVEIVRDGMAAVERLCGQSDHLPDLVLLDWKLPKLMGAEVLERVRVEDRLKDIPVVAFSSSDGSEDISECRDLGGNDYVVKPVEYGAFLSTVQIIIAKYCQQIDRRPSVRTSTRKLADIYTSRNAAAS